MTQCSKMNLMWLLCWLVGWLAGLFQTWVKKNVFNKYKWKVFHLTIYTVTGDNFSAVLIHDEEYNHIF